MRHVSRFHSFVTGMILAFDVTGLFASSALSRTALPPARSDRDNLASDWLRVGNDFRTVMRGAHE